MRSREGVVLCVALMALASEGRAADYTGLWKGKCSDPFGVQIQRTDGDLYSVSLCSSHGCSKPAEWTTTTPIDGDPKYRVVSTHELQIGPSIYVKCESDPTWTADEPPAGPEDRGGLDCSPGRADEEGVLIAWVTEVRTTTQFRSSAEETTTVEPFRPLALLDGSSLKETAGAWIREGQPFWPVLDSGPDPLQLSSVGSFLDHMNDDHCVYFGSLGAAELPTGTLLSSRPLPGVFRAPTAADRATFRRLNPICEPRGGGDYPEGQAPCVRPELLAVSDIDADRMPEYWSREPYTYDFGLTVWEHSGTLVPLLAVCVGCSD